MFRKILFYNKWRNLTKTTPAVFFPLLNDRTQYDIDSLNKEELLPTKGIEAVKRIFQKNELGESSVELHNVAQMGTTAAVFGAVFGGFIRSREAYLYFIENNQATAFETTRDAQKKLQNYVTVAFGKGAYHYGLRVGYFCICFSFISTLISVYRGETSVLEYTLSAAITGALYKINLGLAAALVGAGLGAVFGTVAGVLIVGLLKISGLTMNDIRKAMYMLRDKRQQQMNEAQDKASKVMSDDITKHHDTMVAEYGEKKITEL